MKSENIKKITLSLALGLVLQFSSKASAQPNSEDISLPADLQTTKFHLEEEPSVLDECRIHGGLSLMNSFQDFAVSQGIRERGGIKGFQLNLGIDLFSIHWIAEGDLLYFPESQVGSTRLSSNSFELRFLYDTPIFEAVTVHLGAGIGNRTYNIKNDLYPSRSFGSGATVLVTGIDYWANADISAGVELSNHLPLANGDDPSSVDLGIRLNGHF